ncbi:MAG: YdcF family protein [Gammaproteobacteria bacterium]|nr:YdcF family protein [Gammaproteobacteria bacterium]MBU1600587.1 YdcF family protein [Gammaproteobacteria bacterium]MBU2435043.1 YdcF family protein [Gammaproteobacteria bacterium]MBU2448279.1 YdcF family protein [Gammaproteobacteria bacterium]
MTFALTLKLLISTLLLPPGNGLALLCVAGLYRRRRWAFGLAVAATLLSIAQCLPVVAHALIATLENQSAAIAPDAPSPPAGAIVVLGSGLATDAAEYGGDTSTERTLVRARYGATLARRYALPVLVTGGRPINAGRSEAEVMADILDAEFGVKVRWREDEAMDTAGNAAGSARLLKAAGIDRILLVTHAFHMPRARLRFEQAGLEVVPAPTAFFSHPDDDWLLGDFLPQPKALQMSYYALHEWLGMAWIALTH